MVCKEFEEKMTYRKAGYVGYLDKMTGQKMFLNKSDAKKEWCEGQKCGAFNKTRKDKETIEGIHREELYDKNGNQLTSLNRKKKKSFQKIKDQMHGGLIYEWQQRI